MPSDYDIWLAASRFRATLDALDPMALGVWADRFPAGCCDICSHLLAHYLCKQFDINFIRVRGKVISPFSPHRVSHVWLLWEGLTVDITGDQFGWPKVIVGRALEQHGAAQDRECSSFFPSDDEWWKRECGRIWAAACSLSEQPRLGNPPRLP